jgi:hypothetical protein
MRVWYTTILWTIVFLRMVVRCADALSLTWYMLDAELAAFTDKSADSELHELFEVIEKRLVNVYSSAFASTPTSEPTSSRSGVQQVSVKNREVRSSAHA